MRRLLLILFVMLFAFACEDAETNNDNSVSAGVCKFSSFLDFGAIATGQSKKLPVSVSCSQTSDLMAKVVGVNSGDYSLSPDNLSVVAGVTYNFTLTFKPEEIGDADNKNAILQISSSADAKNYQIPINAKAVAGNAPTFSLTKIDFGTIGVNFPLTKSVTISNDTTKQIIISEIKSSNSVNFLIASNCVGTYLPSNSCNLYVTFESKTAGEKKASITLSYTVAGEGVGTRIVSMPVEGVAR